MNTLYIDTRNNKEIVIRLATSNGEFEEKSEANSGKAQMILPLVDKVLKNANIQPSEISEIVVERGPGAFTGIRVGVAIANALSFGSDIKINGKPLGEIEIPEY